MLGSSKVLEDTRLIVPPGSVVICGHHTYHRATRSVEGCQWRAMFKLNAARVSEPRVTGGPSWLHEGDIDSPHHLFGDHASMAHHGVWEGVWGWLKGQDEAAAAQFQSPHSIESLRRTLATSSSEVDCVDAGYSLGLLVHKAATIADRDAALSALQSSFLSGRERSRRASMHGFGAAGDAAVPFLLKQLTFDDGEVRETASTDWDKEHSGETTGCGVRFAQQSRTIGALHALGRCALSPSVDVVDGLIHAIDTAMDLISTAAEGIVLEDIADSPAFAGGDFNWAALERRRAVSEASCSLGLIGQRLVATAADASADQAVSYLTLSHRNTTCLS